MSFEAQKSESVPFFECSILSHTMLTPKLHNIVVNKPKHFIYQVGQHIRLYLDDDTFRLYSIANAPHHPYLELHIQEPNHDNYLKNFLFTLEINQTIYISESMGKLVFPPRVNLPTLFIAGGYAFAPFKAIIEDLYIKEKADIPVYLYWGIPTVSNLYYNEELQKIQNDTDWFNYQLILSGFDDKWQGATGNLVDFIFCDFNNLEDFNMYVAGSKNMVTEIYYKALQNNLSKNNFYSDYSLDI